MKQTLSLLSILALSFVSCGEPPQHMNVPQQQKDTFDIASVKKHIHEANLAYGERFHDHDKAWYRKKYCEDACSMPPNEPALCGIDAIQAYFYDGGKNTDSKVTIEAIAISGRDNMVVEEGTYSFTDNKGSFFDQGKFIAIWKKENDTWKLYREIWNSDKKTVN